MKNLNFIRYLAMAIAVFLSIQACEEDDEIADDTDDEFVASSSDFSDFRNWTELSTVSGPDPAIGPAHQANDETTTRTIYIKENVNRMANGEFPVGTILVKDTQDDAGNTVEVTAMVKRGNGFDADNNDWEWFMLMPDGVIAIDNGSPVRGAIQMCSGCHAQNQDEDYVFSK